MIKELAYRIPEPLIEYVFQLQPVVSMSTLAADEDFEPEIVPLESGWDEDLEDKIHEIRKMQLIAMPNMYNLRIKKMKKSCATLPDK